MRQIRCEKDCFKDSITLEDMVKILKDENFCETKEDNCERRQSVDLILPLPPLVEESGESYYHANSTYEGHSEDTSSYSTIIVIGCTAILSIILTVVIGGIVLRMLR